jgi:hypothetical protein
MFENEIAIFDSLQELLDRNPCACRGVLGLCAVQLTREIPSAAVTLGERPLLKINPDFVRAHCRTSDDLHTVLMHEFLHVMLRHTQKFPVARWELNLALDLVINPMVCRMLGEESVDFFLRLYGAETGLLRLLGPPRRAHEVGVGRHGSEPRVFDDANAHLERLHRVAWAWNRPPSLADVMALLFEAGLKLQPEQLPRLLGQHVASGEEGEKADASVDQTYYIERHVLPALGKWGAADLQEPSLPQITALQRWKVDVRQLLRSVLIEAAGAGPGPSGILDAVELPYLTPADRRSALRSLWAPIFPMSRHPLRPRSQGAVAIYLDVSGSMDDAMPHLIGLLQEHAAWIRPPLLAFSTVVAPAVLRHGKLATESTGGTALSSVYAHLARTRPARALVITDGYVEPGLPPPPVPLTALLTPDGFPHLLTAAGIPVHTLPAFPSS